MKGMTAAMANAAVRAAMAVVIGCGLVGLPTGCATGGKAQLAAADSIEVLSGEIERAIEESRTDVSRFDDWREADVVHAFIQRVRSGQASDVEHGVSDLEALAAALARIRADRQTAWDRYTASKENIAELRKIAAGLRSLAMTSLSLDEQTRAYMETVLPKASPADEGSSSASRGRPTTGRSASRRPNASAPDPEAANP